MNMNWPRTSPNLSPGFGMGPTGTAPLLATVVSPALRDLLMNPFGICVIICTASRATSRNSPTIDNRMDFQAFLFNDDEPGFAL